MLSGNGGVRWRCPMCESESIYFRDAKASTGKRPHKSHRDSIMQCAECSHWFTFNSRIISGKKDKRNFIREEVAKMLDRGVFEKYQHSEWIKSPTFDLYLRVGHSHRPGLDGQFLTAVISNVTSKIAGIGNYRRLLQYLEDEGRKLGYQYIAIENPCHSHIAMYERHGFKTYYGLGLNECRKNLHEQATRDVTKRKPSDEATQEIPMF